MKIPKTFLPEKNLEHNIEQFLHKKPEENFLTVNNTEIEPGITKAGFYFNESLELLKVRGYERHLRPYESFKIIIDSLRGDLPTKTDILAEELLESIGEWLSIALERKGSKITCYLDPENIKFNQLDRKYYTDGPIKCSDKKEFNFNHLTATHRAIWIDPFYLRTGNEFVEYIYGYKISDAPEELKAGTRICLPSENELCPMARGRGSQKFMIFNDEYAASRGAREKKR